MSLFGSFRFGAGPSSGGKEEKMPAQSIYDGKRDGLYRDREKEFMIHREVRSKSMTNAHYHPYYEIFYVANGSCRMFVEHSLFSVSAGEMVVLPPSTLHRTQYDRDAPVERTTVSFTPRFVEGARSVVGERIFDEALSLGKTAFAGRERDKAESALSRLLAEEGTDEDFADALRKAVLSELLVLAARNAGKGERKEEPVDETEANIQKAAKHIFEQYSDDITLKDASSVAGMSETYFSRKFKEVTGFGFKEYLTNIRMQHAMQMLSAGDLSVTQIAAACGFPDANYFGDTFRKRTGLSPRDFRKKRKAEKCVIIV